MCKVTFIPKPLLVKLRMYTKYLPNKQNRAINLEQLTRWSDVSFYSFGGVQVVDTHGAGGAPAGLAACAYAIVRVPMRLRVPHSHALHRQLLFLQFLLLQL